MLFQTSRQPCYRIVVRLRMDWGTLRWSGLDVCIGIHLSVELQTDPPMCGRSYLSQSGVVTLHSMLAVLQLRKSFLVCGVQLGFALVKCDLTKHLWYGVRGEGDQRSHPAGLHRLTPSSGSCHTGVLSTYFTEVAAITSGFKNWCKGLLCCWEWEALPVTYNLTC